MASHNHQRIKEVAVETGAKKAVMPAGFSRIFGWSVYNAWVHINNLNDGLDRQ